MRWSREAQSPLSTRLRTLIVLGLISALAVTPLLGNQATQTWLNPGGADTVAGSLSPPPSESGESVPAAAPKRKRDKQDKNKQKANKKGAQKKPKDDKQGHDRAKGRDHANKKGTHHRAGNNKPDKPRSGKRSTDRGAPDRKRKNNSVDTIRSATSGVAAAADVPLTITPDADAQVSEANPDVNYGSVRRLAVDSGLNSIQSYLRFDISGVSAPVQQATLRLWVRGNSDSGTRDGPVVLATSTDWTETGITWNTQPTPASSVLDDKGALDRSAWVEYDVTSAVSGDGSVAFVLLPESRDGVSFESREGDHEPKLVIAIKDDTQPPPPEPSPTSTTEPDPTATPDVTSTPDATSIPEPTATPTPTPIPTPMPPTGGGATLLAAGDIASCSSSGDEATANLLDDLAGTVATLGDNAYQSGTTQEFTDCYGSNWGRHKNRTRPALGNHDYETAGATGYFGYFDPVVQTSYYSYELGNWHIVVLDSNCSQVGGCGVGSAQEQWLRADLAAHPATCTLAYWHHPRFSFGNYGNDTRTQALWQALDEAGAEIVLAGHDHNYQRWTPRNGAGDPDPTGIRQFVVGTGGKSHYALGSPPPNVEKANDETYGILELTLRATGYAWQFVPIAGDTFTDSGTDTCH